jgi:hypothetical protein
MTAKTEWSYMELPEGWYKASISKNSDRHMLRILPARGDMCCEGYFNSEAEAAQAMEDWIADRHTPLRSFIYSASY